jgi:hypothetical protein
MLRRDQTYSLVATTVRTSPQERRQERDEAPVYGAGAPRRIVGRLDCGQPVSLLSWLPAEPCPSSCPATRSMFPRPRLDASGAQARGSSPRIHRELNCWSFGSDCARALARQSRRSRRHCCQIATASRSYRPCPLCRANIPASGTNARRRAFAAGEAVSASGTSAIAQSETRTPMAIRGEASESSRTVHR